MARPGSRDEAIALAESACQKDGLSLPPYRTVRPRWFPLGRLTGWRVLGFRDARRRMSTANDWSVVRIDRAGKIVSVHVPRR